LQILGLATDHERCAVNVLRHVRQFIIVIALIAHVLLFLAGKALDKGGDGYVVGTDGFVHALIVLILKQGKDHHVDIVAVVVVRAHTHAKKERDRIFTL
jgi:hypothetical protein